MKIEYINIWKKYELLEKLTLSEATKCAESLSKISNILSSDSVNAILNQNEKDYVIQTIIPIVRKLYNYNLNRFPNEYWLFKDYIKFLNKQKDKLKSEEIIDLYCEKVVRKFKKENVKKGEK